MPTSALIVVLFFLVASYFVINAFLPDKSGQAGMMQKKKKIVLDKEGKKKKQGFEALNALGAFNAPLLKSVPKLKEKYSKMLEQANIKLSVEGLIFMKEALFVFFVVIAIILELDPPIILLMMAIAYIIPDFYVRKIIKEREFQILRTFPEMIDLIGLCLSAGLDFMSSLKWLTEGKFTFDNPFVEDLSRLKDEIAFGKSRKQALKDMQERLNIVEVSSLARTLIIAESMGVSVSESFERFSLDVRERRFHRGERQARMSAIIILFPLILFIMPVVGIIIMGPIILKFSQGGFMGGMM